MSSPNQFSGVQVVHFWKHLNTKPLLKALWSNKDCFGDLGATDDVNKLALWVGSLSWLFKENVESWKVIIICYIIR